MKLGRKKISWIPMFIAVLFIRAMLWKQPRCPNTNEWVKKMFLLHVFTLHGILFSQKEE
jgi:hypothetical protein